jgi:hypothetical protein
MFVPTGGYKPQGGAATGREGLPENRLILDSIDVYNVAPGTPNAGKDVSNTAYAHAILYMSCRVLLVDR